MKLTKTVVERLQAPESGAVFHRDSELRGFGVKVFASGTKTFFLEKRVTGKVKRITIGRFGEITAEQARREAVKLAGQIATGGDPSAERARQRMESTTLRQAFETYMERRTLKPQTIFDIRRCMNEVYPDWLGKPLTGVSADMVVRRHRDYGQAHSEARANLAMRYLRAIFNFAIAEYTGADGAPMIENNPVKKLSQTRSWHRVERRRSLIQPHELAPWFAAVEAFPNTDAGDYLKLLVLTGLRREEGLGLTWADVDLVGKTLTVKDPKNRQEHTLPLSDYLLELLSRRRNTSVSTYVFADARGRRISNLRYALAAVEKASGVRATPHDLRRTFATVAESLDIPAYALKRLLNHSIGADVTAGYIVTSVERLREPMQKITDYMLKAGGLRVSAEVIPLKGFA